MSQLSCKCASRHSGVAFFVIGPSKLIRSMWRFVHFDLHMCFAPQRRAIFLDRNIQTWSRAEVLCAF